ncbi:MAG TPA: V-type ATP synthase subunit F [Clostridiaceae bacterium]|nr:V-type ATP synthase subunit F [Clostridiaceae bacterium]
MHQVGVIGDLDSIIGFRALGMTVKPVEGPAEVLSALKSMVDEEYAIVFLSEPAADDPEVQAFLDEQRHMHIPAVILIPSARRKATIGKEQLRKSVRKATGFDLLREM